MMNQSNLSLLQHNVNLVDLTTQAGVTLRREGHSWFAGPCPFCGGTDRFVVHETDAGWRWFCRGCGGGKYHDTIEFYKRWRGVGFRQACADLGALPFSATVTSAMSPWQKGIVPPSAEAQDVAHEIIVQSKHMLWTDRGEKARAWLHGRGLTDETLHRWQIGYVPGRPNQWVDLAGLHVPCGIVIPGIVGDVVWYVKIRRAAGKPKYLQIKGLATPALFGADTLATHDVAVMTEGEFDAMLLDQVAGDIAGAMTLGSQSVGLNVPTWAGYLLPIAHLLVAYDIDAAGEVGASRLMRITSRALRVTVPVLRDGDKDITDYYRRGGDLRAWLIHIVDSTNQTTKQSRSL